MLSLCMRTHYHHSRKLEKMLLLGHAVLAPSWECKGKVLFVSKFQKVKEHCLPKYLLYWRETGRGTPSLVSWSYPNPAQPTQPFTPVKRQLKKVELPLPYAHLWFPSVCSKNGM